MHKTIISMSLISLLSLSASAVSAAGQMKPGLWEMTIKTNAAQTMPQIPPEAREKMRQMGVSVPEMRDGAMVTKVCMTKEMVDQDKPPHMDRAQTGCQIKNHNRSGNSYSAEMVCDGPHLTGKGIMKGTFNSNESVTSVYDFKGTAQGRPVDQHHESSGKWLNASCGDIKPYTDFMPKNK